MRQITSSRPLLIRAVKGWGDKVLMLALIVASAIEITRLDFPAIQPGQAAVPGQDSLGGMTIRYENLHLWVPETLMDLVADTLELAVPPTHDELKASLECRGLGNVWYAITTRCHQVNGGTSDITFIRHPCHDAQIDQEFLAVLATVAGKPPSDPLSDLSTAEIHWLPGASWKREPREVLHEWSSLPRSHSERAQNPGKGIANVVAPPPPHPLD